MIIWIASYPKSGNKCFKNLSKMESDKGFSEARKDQKFFSLGKKNMWQELLPLDIKNQMEKKFYNEMKELNYLG